MTDFMHNAVDKLLDSILAAIDEFEATKLPAGAGEKWLSLDADVAALRKDILELKGIMKEQGDLDVR